MSGNGGMYYPYWNTFHDYPRCSQFGDPCSSDRECLPSCSLGVNAGSVPLVCTGSDYEKQRHMGKCYAPVTRVGDPCNVGAGPAATAFEGGVEGACGPGLYCQEMIYVDSNPNSAPSFAAPSVGQGYCMPLPKGRKPYVPKTNFWLQ